MKEAEAEKVLKADAQRRAAMVAGDVNVLGELLSDDLIWTHSSGKTDTRQTFLESIASGAVRYLELETSGVSLLCPGDTVVCHGLLHGRATRDGVEKSLESRFLAVWSPEGGQYRLLAWQSTGL